MDDIDTKNDPQNPQKDTTLDNQDAFAGDVSLDDVLTQQAQNSEDLEKKKKRDKQIKYGGIGVAFLFVAFLLFSCGPGKGPMEYGVCATFLELNTPYPNTLRFKNVEGSQTNIRIYYTSIDPFGQYKEEMIECRFRTDRWELAEVNKNRRPVDPVLVQKFNLTIPTILESDPDLTLPPHWKNKLVE